MAADQPTTDKIRALCHELAARHRLDDATRDELCAHLEDKLAGYLIGEVRISEEDALTLVRAHFGDAEKIARLIGREQAAPAIGPDVFFSRGISHDRLYSILLVVLAASTAMSVPLGLVVYILRARQGVPAFAWAIPDWVAPWNAMICTGYLVLMVLTAWLRRTEPAAGRRVTRVLNFLLLPAIPFGTALGIYGLMKVDKDVASPTLSSVGS
jgi:hypothetical protein